MAGNKPCAACGNFAGLAQIPDICASCIANSNWIPWKSCDPRSANYYTQPACPPDPLSPVGTKLTLAAQRKAAEHEVGK